LFGDASFIDPASFHGFSLHGASERGVGGRIREDGDGGGGKREEGVYGGAFHIAREPLSRFDGYIHEEGPCSGEGALPFHVLSKKSNLCGRG